ncbi:MAG: matrixin family metalloprotease [Candidatus Paceibacterota bacterium]
MNIEDRNKIQIGVGIGLTVVVLGLLAWAIGTHVTGNSGEPGLMSVCWRANGQADFNTSVCSTPEEVRWDRSQVPLVVRGPDHPQLHSAIQSANTQVGCEVLQWQESDGSSDFDILVSLDVPMTAGTDHPGGATSFRRDASGRMKAYADVFAGGMDATMLVKVISHELGHALGLAHDDWSGSIMRPAQRSGLEFVRISDNDRRILHDLYCSQ